MSDPEADPTASLREALRAGAAVYNAGEFHAAHDAWEDRWLALEADTDDERLLHGLIQFTAVVHHARNRNWSGATGLAASAVGYLSGIEEEATRGVDLDSVRNWLSSFLADPERIERTSPPRFRVDDTVVEAGVLTLDEVAIAASVVAEEHEYDEAVVVDAVRFGREKPEPDSTKEAQFLRDFVADRRHRSLVFQRLTELVERRRREERDVSGLFESREE